MRTISSIFTVLAIAIFGTMFQTPAAYADSAACTTNYFDPWTWGEVLYGSSHSDYNGRDIALPATLHGKTVRLMNGRYTNKSFARVENPSAGDIVSIDRATSVTNTTRTWWYTYQISSWEYCQTRIDSSGGWARSPAIDNWHRPVRVCLRHNGALQCTNIWYADQG